MSVFTGATIWRVTGRMIGQRKEVWSTWLAEYHTTREGHEPWQACKGLLPPRIAMMVIATLEDWRDEFVVERDKADEDGRGEFENDIAYVESLQRFVIFATSLP